MKISETESYSESDSDENIRKVEKALSALELNRIHKPKFSPRIGIPNLPLRISNLRKQVSKVNLQFRLINYTTGISMV